MFKLNKVKTLRDQWAAKFLLVLFIFFSGWWVYMTIFLPKSNPLYSYFGAFYGIIALWGFIWGIIVSSHWGGFKSIMGRAIIMFSLGLAAQEFGQCAYSYYIFALHVSVPYPSIGDIGFFSTMPFYIYGAYLIARASGAKVSLRSFKNKVQVIIIPLIILIIVYFLFLRDFSLDFSKPIETFLDIAYPLGPAIYISIGLLTYSITKNILGGIMRPRILFLIAAFTAQFFADYMFIFFKDKYFPGSILDYLYVVAYFLMAFSLMQLQTVFITFRHVKK